MIYFDSKDIELTDIHKMVCKKFNFSYADIFRKTRKREIVEARQVFCYLSRSLTKESLENIGKYIGRYRKENLDHATVRHAFVTIKNLIDVDKCIRDDVNDLYIDLKDLKPKCSIVVSNVQLIKSCIVK